MMIEIKDVSCAGEGIALTRDDIRVSVPRVFTGETLVTLEFPIGCDQADMSPDQARRLARALLAKANQAGS